MQWSNLFYLNIMRIISRTTLKLYWEKHPQSKTALCAWCDEVCKANWTSLADIKATFNSADYVGNQRYVFNIKGNVFRLIMVIKFIPKLVYVRFVGTHADYDKIDCSTI